MASFGCSLRAALGGHGRLNFTCCRVAVKWDMDLERGMLGVWEGDGDP